MGRYSSQLRTEVPRREQQEFPDLSGLAPLKEERTDRSGVPTECADGVRVRLWLRNSVCKRGPLGNVKPFVDFTDTSASKECAEGVRTLVDRLRLRRSVAKTGPSGTVKLKCDLVELEALADWTERQRTGLDLSGVPASEGVRVPTEWLRLRASVARLGPFGNVSVRVEYCLPGKLGATDAEAVDITERIERTDRTDRSGVPARERLAASPSPASRLGVVLPERSGHLPRAERLREEPRRAVRNSGAWGTVRSKCLATLARLELREGVPPASDVLCSCSSGAPASPLFLKMQRRERAEACASDNCCTT